MEEKIWDIHSFRKNLMLISIINIIIIFFWAENITKIDFIFFHLEHLENWKVFTILLIGNIYTLWRYWQYVKITPSSKNYMFLLKEITNNKNIDKNFRGWNNSNTMIIDEKWNVIHKDNKWKLKIRNKSILNKKEFFITIVSIENSKYKNKISLYKDIKHKDWRTSTSEIYHIDYNKDQLNKNYPIQDKYYADILLPFIIWIIWIFLTEWYLFYTIWKI